MRKTSAHGQQKAADNALGVQDVRPQVDDRRGGQARTPERGEVIYIAGREYTVIGTEVITTYTGHQYTAVYVE